MNRNLLIIICTFLSIIATFLLGNIIVIGDKLGQITHVYVEYAFYVIIIVLAYIYILRPVIKVHKAPELPVLSIDGKKDVKKLYFFLPVENSGLDVKWAFPRKSSMLAVRWDFLN